MRQQKILSKFINSHHSLPPFMSWLPFMTMYWGYEILTALTPALFSRIDGTTLIAWEKVYCFGNIPAAYIYWHRLRFRPLDDIMLAVYISHPLNLLIAGLLISKFQPKEFDRYWKTNLAACFTSLAIHALWPTAPPWWGAKTRYFRLEPGRMWGYWGTLYEEIVGWVMLAPLLKPYFGPYVTYYGDPFAAFPSLHAALAVLSSTFTWKLTRRTLYRLVILSYISLVFASTVWTGNHFVVDLIAGTVIAILWQAKFEGRIKNVL
jgi:membrane-associated phospholipid phosphatase